MKRRQNSNKNKTRHLIFSLLECNKNSNRINKMFALYVEPRCHSLWKAKARACAILVVLSLKGLSLAQELTNS